MRKLLNYMDYLVRGVALCGLIPFGKMGFFLSIMSTDSGSMIDGFIALGLVSLLIGLIATSAVIPKSGIDNLPKILRYTFVVRLPAYLFLLPSIWLIWNMWLKHII